MSYLIRSISTCPDFPTACTTYDSDSILIRRQLESPQNVILYLILHTTIAKAGIKLLVIFFVDQNYPEPPDSSTAGC